MQQTSRTTLVYMHKDRKIRHFSGNPQNESEIRIEDWVEDIRSYVTARSLGKTEQVDFITAHLEGQPREEIRYRPYSVRNDPGQILETLISAFGCQYGVARLQREFFDRKQREGETLRSYSLVLLDLIDRVIKTDTRCIPNRDKWLVDQFSHNVVERNLRKHLSHLSRIRLDIPFLELRDEAMKWSEVDDEDFKVKVKVSKPLVHEASVEITDKIEDRLSKLTDIVEKQQEQIKDLSETIKARQINPRRDVRCYNCNEQGNYASKCSKPNKKDTKKYHTYESKTGANSLTVDSCTKSEAPPAEIVDRVIGTCPSVDVVMDGVVVPCLLDTGSMVTMITESFFKENFKFAELKQSSSWLTLLAANGLEIPYVGYIEFDMEVNGNKIPNRGVLIVKDSAGNKSSPGIVGMNVLSQCPSLLPNSWNTNKVSTVKNIGFARVAGGAITLIPAQSMKVIAVTGNHFSQNAVIEPLRGNYPHILKGIVVANTLSENRGNGTFNVKIVNVGQEPIFLKPKTKVGLIHNVDCTDINDSDIEFVRANENEEIIKRKDGVDVKKSPVNS